MLTSAGRDWLARASLLDDLPADTPAWQRATTSLRAQVHALMQSSPQLASDLGRFVQDRPEDVEFVHNLAHVLLRDPERRQAWQESDDRVARAELVMAALAERM